MKYECTVNTRVVKYETFKVFDSLGNICLHLPLEEVNGTSKAFKLFSVSTFLKTFHCNF